MVRKIVIGSDHGGYKLKEKLIQYLTDKGINVVDVGTGSEESCDYPVYGFDAAKMVSQGKVKRGIVICKSGIGMSIIANKLPGVRAGLCRSEKDAVSSREHNDTNVLVLSAATTKTAKSLNIIKKWLNTDFLKGRHARRVRQIKEFEKKVFKKLSRAK